MSNTTTHLGGAPGPNGPLKSINPSWPVWGGATKRNASGSSVGVTDLGEQWTQSRSSSGSWPEEPQGNSQRTSGALYTGPRHRPGGAHKSSLSREALGFDQNQPRHVSMPAGKFGAPLFATSSNSYDASQTDSDLANAMRGMAVVDEQSAQTTTMPFYPQPSEYGGYTYPTADPTLYASSPALSTAPPPGAHAAYGAAAASHLADPRQASVYYDYANATRHASPYFYHPPAMMYPAASPMVPHQQPATLSDQKRDMQFLVTHNQALNHQAATMGHQALMYPGMRPPTSPLHPQSPYGDLAYQSQLSGLIPAGAGMYGAMHPQAAAATQRFSGAAGASARQGRREGNADQTLRSPLLEDFRANKTRKWELRDITGFVVEFSGDQHGSRFIQQKLESATPEETQAVFDEIMPAHALPLIQDVFGNYVIQKLFEFGTQSQRSQLATAMDGHILQLSLQMYGCRVVQKAVEYISQEQKTLFVQELDQHVMKCVKDANGNHVIQKMIECVPADRLDFVYTFRGNVYELSTHPYGCRVLQRCFEHLPDDQTRPLLDELHKYTINLMQDQFGNYVIQFVLEHGAPHDRELIVQKLRGQMLNMARHKFASNVCEKALLTATRENRAALIDEIMTPKSDGNSPIAIMMKDQFANYVLQRALGVVDEDQREALFAKVRPQLVSMRRYSSAYSKHLIAIERLLEKGEAVKTPATSTTTT